MLTPDEQATTYLSAGEGETLWVLGAFVTLKAQSDDVSFYEVICPPEAGPPPNIHHQQDEAFYVLEGTFSFLSGDETIETGPGSFVWIPRGTVHTFKYIGESTGKLLVASTFPGSHERFFRDVGVPVDDIATFEPPDGPPDMEKVLASAERNDIHFVLPEETRG
jgi:mannose-6-phosphate isomerase-like protein (cupin superfamily)